MARRILVDGDWLVYTAGFAGQKTEYAYINAGGKLVSVAPNLTELKEAVGPTFAADNVFSRVVVDPLDHVLHSVRMMLDKAVAEVQERHGEDFSEVTVLIDGDGNFRHRLATIRPYKGNRATPRPARYPDIREYLADRGAELVYGHETDDELSIRWHQAADDDKPVIVGVDKDLLQIPGLHYNPNKGFCTITPELGELLVYRQCLTGDTTDNIGGCYKCGDKRAHALLKLGMSAAEKWALVVKEYQASLDKYGSELYNGLMAEQAAVENMRLVWLLTRPGEVWEPPV